jgi:nucleotide-binding universal stress UspA family protein
VRTAHRAFSGEIEEDLMASVNRAHWPILVGVDGSRSATDAVRWAAHEALRRRTGLRLVEAFGWMPIGGDDPGGAHIDPSYPSLLLRAARDRLADAAVVAGQIAPGTEITTEVLADYPVSRLVTESQSAQLVVVGARGLAGITGMLIGSVAAGLAAHAACPTVVVRGAEPGGPIPMDGPVVVGVDGSPTSEAALAFAFDAAAARRAPLVALHTWRDTMIDPTLGPLIDWDLVELDEQQLLAERLAGWGTKYPDVTVERVVTKDRPAHSLQAHSVGAQLMVVGSRWRGGLTGTILGSVSQALLHHAACPVAIVRPDTRVDE